VIVENKVGAGGNIGADAVAKARWRHHRPDDQRQPDHRQAAQPALRYDPATDFAPISLIGVAPLVLVAPVSAPGADARAFLDAARQAGDSWSYGSPGVGTVGHLGMELLKARTGIAPVHVPYPGYPRCSAAWCAASCS
jgi:tripartite-type tricarboxylate transporter receptor subunit TctC